MAQSKEHVTRMLRKELHDKGACILRHPDEPRKGSPCDYKWNGYTISLTTKLNDQSVTVIRDQMSKLSERLLKIIKSMPAGESLDR